MKSEHLKAKAWRERLTLSVADLAKLTGYSTKAIYWFEQGLVPRERNAKAGDPADRTIKPHVWLRYKMACAGVAAQLFHQQKFEW